jgi:imidazolonepropionase-like amidohydrolase
MQRITALVVGLLLAFAGNAQDTASKPATSTTTVLKAAHLFDGRSGALTSPGLVVVKDERIVAVGKDAAIPDGAQVMLSQGLLNGEAA